MIAARPCDPTVRPQIQEQPSLMLARIRSMAPPACPIVALLDRRLLAWAALWSVASLVAFGVGSAIIPNAVFGRQIPPEPFAIWTWVASAPLMGLVLATYTVPVPASPAFIMVTPDGSPVRASTGDAKGSRLGMIAGLGAFLAIGCPVCNKIALILLGTSGALTIFAPIQPVIGAVSLALLAGTLAWRLRSRARGGACAVRPA
jgi:hypothetical protein